MSPPCKQQYAICSTTPTMTVSAYTLSLCKFNVQISHLINRCHPTLVSFFLSLTRLPRASSNSLLCHGCKRYVGVVCHVLQLLQNRFTYTTKLVSHQQICDDPSEKKPRLRTDLSCFSFGYPEFSTAYIGGPPNSSASPSLFLGVQQWSSV